MAKVVYKVHPPRLALLGLADARLVRFVRFIKSDNFVIPTIISTSWPLFICHPNHYIFVIPTEAEGSLVEHMSRREYYVYIMASASGTLYTGVCNNLLRRVSEHKSKSIEGFSKKYNCTKLVYYEATNDITSAIAREKQIKNWRREKKENLIRLMNPGWNDLYFYTPDQRDSSARPTAFGLRSE